MISGKKASRLMLYLRYMLLAALFLPVLLVALASLSFVDQAQNMQIAAESTQAEPLSAAPAAARFQNHEKDTLPYALIFTTLSCFALIWALLQAKKEKLRLMSDRLMLELSEERFRLMARHSDVIVFELNFQTQSVIASENFDRMLGPCPNLDDFLHCDLVHPEDQPVFDRLLLESKLHAENVTGELRLLATTGEYTWFSVLISSFAGRGGNTARVIGKLQNIDQEKREKASLELRASTDLMTRLLNKGATEAAISPWLADDSNQSHALLIVDIDNLKIVNDSFGHGEGDRAIQEAAVTLRRHFRSTDVIGRVGGDEFMVFLHNVDSEARLHNSICSLVQKFSQIRLGEDRETQLHASVGAALSTGQDNFESLYKKADKALYYVKRNGKNDYAFYSPQMEQAGFTLPSKVRHECHHRRDLFDSEALDQLLSAVSAYFTLILSVNLTRDTYCVMNHWDNSCRLLGDTGSFTRLAENIAAGFYPDEREEFYAVFAREALLAQYAKGETQISFSGDGCPKKRSCARTSALFVQPERKGEVCMVLLIEESPLT